MEAARIDLLGRVTLLASGLPAILGLFAMGVVLPWVAREFAALPHAELLSQMAGGIVGLAFAIASPVMGGLVGRLGYRIVYFWSTLVFALAGLSVMLLDNLYLILLTRVILGAAVAGVLVAAATGISTLPERQRTPLFGLQTMVGGGLGLLSYIIVAKMAEAGWRTPFALHALGLLMLPFILMLPKTSGGAAASGHHAHGAAAAGGGGQARGGIAALGGLNVAFVLLGLYTGMTGLMPPLVGPFYLNSIGITDPKTIALPLMAAAGAAMIAACFYGRIQHRIGVNGVNGVFAVLLLCTSVGAGLSGLTSTLGQFALAQVVMSIGLAWSIANLNASAVLIAPPHLVARAIAVTNGLFYGAQALLPFIASALRQLAGPAGVFEGYAVVGIVAGLIYLRLAMTEKRHPRVSEAVVEDAIEDATASPRASRVKSGSP